MSSETEKQTITAADVATVKAQATPDKFPRLRAMHAELMEQKKPLAEALAAARAELDALTQSDRVNQLRKTIKELNAQIGPIDQEMGALARAFGAKSIRMDGAGG